MSSRTPSLVVRQETDLLTAGVEQEVNHIIIVFKGTFLIQIYTMISGESWRGNNPSMPLSDLLVVLAPNQQKNLHGLMGIEKFIPGAAKKVIPKIICC